MTKRRKRPPSASELDAIVAEGARRRLAELHVVASNLRNKALRGEPVDVGALIRLETLLSETRPLEDGPKRVVFDIVESAGEMKLLAWAREVEGKLCGKCRAVVPTRPREARPTDAQRRVTERALEQLSDFDLARLEVEATGNGPEAVGGLDAGGVRAAGPAPEPAAADGPVGADAAPSGGEVIPLPARHAEHVARVKRVEGPPVQTDRDRRQAYEESLMAEQHAQAGGHGYLPNFVASYERPGRG